MQCTALKVGELQPLLPPLFPPYSLLLQMVKWAHHHLQLLPLPPFILLPLSPLLSLQLHLLHVHIHVHVHIHFLKLIMLGLSL